MLNASCSTPEGRDPGRWALAGSVVAVGLLMAGAVAMLGWWASKPPAAADLTLANRFVAFSFAVLGLTWLTAIFFLCSHLAGRRAWAGLFRWAAAVDAAGIGLAVAAGVCAGIPWTVGVKLYAVLASFAAAQLAAVWCLRRRGVAHGAAMAVGVGMTVVACTSLLWGHLLNRPAAAGSAADRNTLAVVRYANPLLAANDAVNPPVRFDWPHHGQMYQRYGIIGEARAWALPDWRRACGAYLCLAVVLAGVGLPRRRPAGPDDGSC